MEISNKADNLLHIVAIQQLSVHTLFPLIRDLINSICDSSNCNDNGNIITIIAIGIKGKVVKSIFTVLEQDAEIYWNTTRDLLGGNSGECIVKLIRLLSETQEYLVKCEENGGKSPLNEEKEMGGKENHSKEEEEEEEEYLSLRKYLLKCLWLISRSSSNRDLMKKETKITEIVIDVVKRANEAGKIEQEALILLGNLSNGDANTQAMILRSGVIRPLLALIVKNVILNLNSNNNNNNSNNDNCDNYNDNIVITIVKNKSDAIYALGCLCQLREVGIMIVDYHRHHDLDGSQRNLIDFALETLILSKNVIDGSKCNSSNMAIFTKTLENAMFFITNISFEIDAKPLLAKPFVYEILIDLIRTVRTEKCRGNATFTLAQLALEFPETTAPFITDILPVIFNNLINVKDIRYKEDAVYAIYAVRGTMSLDESSLSEKFHGLYELSMRHLIHVWKEGSKPSQMEVVEILKCLPKNIVAPALIHAFCTAIPIAIREKLSFLIRAHVGSHYSQNNQLIMHLLQPPSYPNYQVDQLASVLRSSKLLWQVVDESTITDGVVRIQKHVAADNTFSVVYQNISEYDISRVKFRSPVLTASESKPADDPQLTSNTTQYFPFINVTLLGIAFKRRSLPSNLFLPKEKFASVRALNILKCNIEY